MPTDSVYGIFAFSLCCLHGADVILSFLLLLLLNRTWAESSIGCGLLQFTACRFAVLFLHVS